MQLLTATKLSTVAMLVVASVIYFQSVNAAPMDHQDVAAGQSNSAAPAIQPAAEMMPVPAVPMERPVVEVAPVEEEEEEESDKEFSEDEVPDEFSMYKSPKSGQPSEQANKDLLAIYSETQELLAPKAKELVTNLNTLWEEYVEGLDEQRMNEDERKEFIAASPVWEKAIKEVTGQKDLKDCPYDLLPYTPDERSQKQSLSDQELLAMIGNRDPRQYVSHMRHNICRLAVNGGYPWLMRIVAMDGSPTSQVVSVLVELKLHSPDRILVKDLDKLLNLFASIMKADHARAYVEDKVKNLVMVSTPTIIPVLAYTINDIIESALLLLAIKQQQSDPDTSLDLDGINLPESVNRGEVTEFIENVSLNNVQPHSWYNFMDSILSSLFISISRDGGTYRQITNHLLDHASNGFERQGNVIQASRPLAAVLKTLNPLEVLVNLINEDEFIKLYDEVYASKKEPMSVVFAGRSRQGTRVLEHAFEHVFGPAGTPISSDLKFGDQALSAEHLARIVMICAINCTKQNREVFFKLLVKKIQNTPRLPGWNGRGPQSATAAQQVADEITEVIEDTNEEHQSQGWRIPTERKQSIQDEVDQVIKHLNKFATELTQGAESTPPAENSPGSLQSLSG